MPVCFLDLTDSVLDRALEVFRAFPDASPGGDPRWLRALIRHYKAQPFVMASGSGDYLLSGYIRRDYRGRRLLYGLRGGMLARDAVAAGEMMAQLREFAARHRLRTCLLSSGLTRLDAGVPVACRTTLTMDIAADEAAQFKLMTQSGRNSVRLARKKGVRIHAGHDLIDRAHALYNLRLGTKGLERLKRPLFHELAAIFGERLEFMVAEADGEDVCAVSVLHGQRKSLYFISGGTAAGQKLCANHLLINDMLERGRAVGNTVLDFSESTPGGGVYTFKVRLGAVPAPVYYYDPVAGPPSGNWRDPDEVAAERKQAAANGPAPEPPPEPLLLRIRHGLGRKAASVGRRIL